MTDPAYHLIDVNDSILILIDIQEWFLNRLDPSQAECLVKNVGFLVEVAKILNVPMVVTAEEPSPTNDLPLTLSAKLPPEIPVFPKRYFGLAGQADIFQAVEQTGRKTAVLVGLETDVCVAQSAIGLLQNGYRVVAISDATGSPNEAHEHGLRRMRDAGVLITSVKGLHYEWVRTVEQNHRVWQEYEKQVGKPIEVEL